MSFSTERHKWNIRSSYSISNKARNGTLKRNNCHRLPFWFVQSQIKLGWYVACIEFFFFSSILTYSLWQSHLLKSNQKINRIPFRVYIYLHILQSQCTQDREKKKLTKNFFFILITTFFPSAVNVIAWAILKKKKKCDHQTSISRQVLLARNHQHW